MIKTLPAVALLVIAVISIKSAIASNFPLMPEAVTNNGVAQVTTSKGHYLLSFMGLSSTKDHLGVHSKVWALKVGDNQWQRKTDVPSSIMPKGRLASTAIGVGKYAYVFGGYTVDAEHNEISSPDVFRYDVEQDKYVSLASMPVPVDDTSAVLYQNRYIYLLSGWHNDGNVNLVQVFDIETNTWQQASPFLGQPVFGQAAAIIQQHILVCDGVAVIAKPDARRGFKGVAQCLLGKIDDKNPLKIDWRTIAHPSSEGRYRMAANANDKSFIFVGGSTNPYNYNGVGYNGEPSMPNHAIWYFDLASKSWRIDKSEQASMDHRGLLKLNGQYITLGGMRENQQVSKDVTVHIR